MDNLKWEGNSKKMYDVILRATPFIFRGKVQREVAKGVKKYNLEVVTEELVFKILDENAPKSALQKILPKVEKLRSR